VIELEATSTDHRVVDAVEFVRTNRHRVGEYIPDHHDGQRVGLSFAGEMWQSMLRDRRRPGRLRRRHFEVCVFVHLAAEFRSGDIAVIGSDSYANLHAQLMLWSECEPLVVPPSRLAIWCRQVLGRRYRVVLEPDHVVRDSSVAKKDHVYLGWEVGALGVVAAEADSGPHTHPLYLLGVDERGRVHLDAGCAIQEPLSALQQNRQFG
jgi:hypothetical protein